VSDSCFSSPKSAGRLNGDDVTGGWREVSLGEIFDISSSKRVRQAQWKTTGVPFYRAREIVKLAKDGIVQNELFISEELYKEYQTQYGVPKPGDLMISAVGTLGACYIVQPEDRFYYKDASVLRFSPKQLVCSRFIQHAFGTNQILDQVHAGSGSTVGTYTISRANKTRLRLPPFSEQRRIAGVLDRAEALRAKRRAALAQLDSLTQSLFLDLFGDPTTNPKGFPTKPLDGLCRGITDIDHKMPVAVEKGVPFISAKDLTDDGRISFESVKQISEEDFRRLSRKSKPEQGDIIYSRIGVNLGKARMVEVSFDFLASYSCCTIKPNRELVDVIYLCSLLDSPFILRQAHKGVRAIGVPDLGMGEIKAFRIIVPPIELQREFSRRVIVLEKLKTAHRASLAELDALFATLQYRAFRGEL
jgi:type I restriction enzyme S subunit